jgi:hypothetical protein
MPDVTGVSGTKIAIATSFVQYLTQNELHQREATTLHTALKTAPIGILRSSLILRNGMSSACRYGVRLYGGFLTLPLAVAKVVSASLWIWW